MTAVPAHEHTSISTHSPSPPRHDAISRWASDRTPAYRHQTAKAANRNSRIPYKHNESLEKKDVCKNTKSKEYEYPGTLAKPALAHEHQTTQVPTAPVPMVRLLHPMVAQGTPWGLSQLTPVIYPRVELNHHRSPKHCLQEVAGGPLPSPSLRRRSHGNRSHSSSGRWGSSSSSSSDGRRRRRRSNRGSWHGYILLLFLFLLLFFLLLLLGLALVFLNVFFCVLGRRGWRWSGRIRHDICCGFRTLAPVLSSLPRGVLCGSFLGVRDPLGSPGRQYKNALNMFELPISPVAPPRVGLVGYPLLHCCWSTDLGCRIFFCCNLLGVSSRQPGDHVAAYHREPPEAVRMRWELRQGLPPQASAHDVCVKQRLPDQK